MPAKGAHFNYRSISVLFYSGFSLLFFMNYFKLLTVALVISNAVFAQSLPLTIDTTLLQPIEINAIKAADGLPLAKTNLYKADIEKNNTGRDLPFIINQTPSVQINADAGNGIGYTGIRIRGIDATRINITINGIPYNDAESQGTYFVNLPDIASSADGIQIQRGVGTSTNGTGAFGGTININTNDIETKKILIINNAAGSYNSWKNTVMLNSGLLKNHFIISGRLSNISSDGYIDRSGSKLQSFFSSAAYQDSKQSLRLNIFSGKEKTHAAWFGINQATLDSNRRYNPAGTEKAGTPYDNETDNYTQTHYQLFYNRKINEFLKFNLTGFLTFGKGYFEQYKAAQELSSYGLPDIINGNDTIKTVDLIRQLWLDNSFYGSTFSVQYNKLKTNFTIGGTLNNYQGKHFGKIISTTVPDDAAVNYIWYNVPANKKEFSIYAKWNQAINKNWQTFVDLQIRNVVYTINGFEQHPELMIKNNYFFFNPKMGITYNYKNNKLYFSYAHAAKEPNRDDFETSIKETPQPEKLHDFELGFEQNKNKYNWNIGIYYMLYKDQLVLTGKVNDVYAYTQTNIASSYRTGIEFDGNRKLNKWLSVNGNMNLSLNKINNFTEYIDNYDDNTQLTKQYRRSDISFSPQMIGMVAFKIKPLKRTEINLNNKYVSKQYLDNTSNDERKLNAYFVQDIRIDYSKVLKKGTIISFFIQGNNIFSKKYEPNGYTFSYISGGRLTTENYYYPMATFNLMSGVNVKM